MKVILIACSSHVLIESILIREIIDIKVEQCLIANQQKKVNIAHLHEPEPFLIKNNYLIDSFDFDRSKKKHYTDQPWKKHFKR